MASAEPRWQTRLRAYRAENNAQFGVRGPSPQEILASNTRPAVPGRIRGLSQRQMYDSNLAARGGDPAGLQMAIEARQAQQQAAEEMAAVERAKATLRAQRDRQTGVAEKTESATAEPVAKPARKQEAAGFQRGESSRPDSRRTLSPSTVTDDDGQKVSWTKWRMDRAAKYDGF